MLKQWSEKNTLEKLGFDFDQRSTHLSRTIMFIELSQLMSYFTDSSPSLGDYKKAIHIENCLGKRTESTRITTSEHLVELYSLDPTVTLFRVLRFLWYKEPEGQELLALLCAYSRDQLLRISSPSVLKLKEGELFLTSSLVQLVENEYPSRYSFKTLRSISQNLASSWTHSGHLIGKVRKTRSQVHPTAASVTYALLLSYLTGIRGELLFQSEYVKLLDCPIYLAIELAKEASAKNWIDFKHISNVMEVQFPTLLTEKDIQLANEQD